MTSSPNPYTDGAALDALGEEMNDVIGRWAWSRQIYGHVFSAKEENLQGLVDFGRANPGAALWHRGRRRAQRPARA